MSEQGYTIRMDELEPGVHSLQVEPSFAIGHRSILVCSDAGNLLWDPLPYIDDNIVSKIEDLGGIQAVSASHPHFYGCQLEWSMRFSRAPIHLAAEDHPWLFRSGEAITHFHDQVEPFPGMTIAKCGGHFPGASIAHWTKGGTDPGCLFVGGALGILEDQHHIAFMYSFANWIPLPAADVEEILRVTRKYHYNRAHGDFHSIHNDAARTIKDAAVNYITWTRGKDPTRL